MESTSKLNQIVKNESDKIHHIFIPQGNTAESFWESFADMVHSKTQNVSARDVIRFSAVDNLEFVNSKGRILKRFRKWYKSEYDVNISDSEFGIIGDCLQYFISKGGLELYFDFTFTFDWNDGQFGHSGSCWWGCYKESLPTFENGGGFAIRFYNDGNQSDDNGIGRTWAIIQDSRIYCFNSYGTSRANVSKALKEFFTKKGIDLHFSKCDIHNSESNEIPYINGGTGFVMYQHGDTIEDGHSHDINLFVESSYRCEACNSRLNEDEIYSAGDSTIYCSDCFNERYFYCEKCGEDCDRDSECECDGKYYCEYCANRLGFQKCDQCNEYHKDIVEYNSDVYCQDCFDNSNLSKCDHCDEVFESDELIEYDNNHYCDDCIPEYAVKCVECDEYIKQDDSIVYNGVHHCESCAKKLKIHKCDYCGAGCLISDMERYIDAMYCSRCIFELAVSGQLELIEA